jgi:hypothetical protein
VNLRRRGKIRDEKKRKKVEARKHGITVRDNTPGRHQAKTGRIFLLLK